MKKYEEDDEVVFYFVIYERGNEKCIRGWSDNKDLVDAYMEFHMCRYYRVKKQKDVLSEMYKILEENTNDEIQLYMINTRGKHGSRSITVPMTLTEFTLVQDESNGFISSRVNYSYINECSHYLKGKYKNALKVAGIEDLVNLVVYGKTSKLLDHCEIDNLMTLYMSLSDQFGE